jgi:Zn-dependent protease with chaperone function
MNFFAHQALATRNTRRLIALLMACVAVIVLTVNALVLLVLGMPIEPRLLVDDPEAVSVVLITSALVLGMIVLASLFRSVQLRTGGALIAEQLGGTRIDANSSDLRHRRLYNIVEEMAIASGVPVPDVFVLERESGINAFAAGYHTQDAAIAVTRGALDMLSRDELQGVVAHEFSHVFSGDMRLNIRLMGVLFGLLVMALIGRLFLHAGGRMGHRGGRNDKGGQAALAFFALGLGLVVIGHIGVLFGNWIKSLVSRQREYLADATAVQFTRNPAGVAGALKKIGALHSRLETSNDEISHMLFASGFTQRLFATHPPLLDRIRAIEPAFTAEEFERIRERMESKRGAAGADTTPDDSPQRRIEPADDWSRLADNIGNPSGVQLALAAALIAAIPQTLLDAAHSPSLASEVLLYLLLSAAPADREPQLERLGQVLGESVRDRVAERLRQQPELAPELRLPLMEISLNALRHCPTEELDALSRSVDELIRIDGRVCVEEYVLAKLLTMTIDETRTPSDSRLHGKAGLDDHREHVVRLVTLLAYHGNDDNLEYARGASRRGLGQLGLHDEPPPVDVNDVDWYRHLDAALGALNELTPRAKEQLTEALFATVTHKHQVTQAEIELLRVIAAAIHVPIPLLLAADLLTPPLAQ